MTQENLSQMLNKLAVPISALAMILGGAAWLSAMYANVQTNSKEIMEIKEEIDKKINSRLQNVDERLARMEGKIDMIIENFRRNHRRHEDR